MVVGLAVVTVALGAAGVGAAGLAVVGVAAGAGVSTGAGADDSGAVVAVVATAPAADFWADELLGPEPQAAPARVRATRPATRPVRNGRRFMVRGLQRGFLVNQ